MARPGSAFWALSWLSVGIDRVGNRERPLQRGCHVRSSSSRTAPESEALRRTADVAPLGEHVSERVLADAVGRRGHFPQGRCLTTFNPAPLEGNAPSGDAKRTRRPGLNIDQLTGNPGRPLAHNCGTADLALDI